MRTVDEKFKFKVTKESSDELLRILPSEPDDLKMGMIYMAGLLYSAMTVSEMDSKQIKKTTETVMGDGESGLRNFLVAAFVMFDSDAEQCGGMEN